MGRDVAIVFDGGVTRAISPDRTHEQLAMTSVLDVARQVERALRARGHRPSLIALPERPKDLLTTLFSIEADAIFNLAESWQQNPAAEAKIAALLECSRIPCTGSRFLSLELCRDKAHARAVLSAAEVSVPAAVALEAGDPLPALAFDKVIVKPRSEDASHGIDATSVCSSAEEVERRRAHLKQHGLESLLIEEYIAGRELNVSILAENEQLRVLPIAEIDFSKMPEQHPHILSYAAKWDVDSEEYRGSESVEAQLPASVRAKVEEQAVRAFRALGLSSYGRVDLRLDSHNQPLVIDVNPNPDLSEDAGFARAALRAGIEYPELIERLLPRGVSC